VLGLKFIQVVYDALARTKKEMASVPFFLKKKSNLRGKATI
jgi:hypothetical protein